MSEVWLIADLHLGHEKLVTGFDQACRGPRGRDFSTLQAMHDVIYANWARVVSSRDKVYVLGDIAFKARHLDELKALPGRKRAVLGNHDLERAGRYAEAFDKVFGARTLGDGLLLTHIPVHPDCLNRKSMRVNVHGHLHDESVVRSVAHHTSMAARDPRYICVSCEQVGYTPINLDEVRAIAARAA